MLNRLDGYDVIEAELQEYLAGLTAPVFDVEVIKRKYIRSVLATVHFVFFGGGSESR